MVTASPLWVREIRQALLCLLTESSLGPYEVGGPSSHSTDEEIEARRG